MKKVIRLSESDLERIIKRVISEESISNEDRKKKVMKILRKISEHIKKYDIEKEEFSSTDMNYFIDMFVKIADHQDIKL